jgi:curved DNA-binding protein
MVGPGTNGGPDGDLYITFIIPDDSNFKRLANDLYTTSTIDLYTAVLGGETIIDTLDSKVKLKVAPGTQKRNQGKIERQRIPCLQKRRAVR